MARLLILLLGVAITSLWLARRVVSSERPVAVPAASIEGTGVRDVRVLLSSDASRVRVRSRGVVRLVNAKPRFQKLASQELTLMPGDPRASGVCIDAADACDDRMVLSGDEPVSLSLLEGGEWSSPLDLPGNILVSRGDGGGLQVINSLDVETYTACVVSREIWPTFETAAFRAQAVAARTFVLYQMQRRNAADFDLVATQGAQVYRGLRDDIVGRRAQSAAWDTRGLVLTYDDAGRDSLFCTYYSAACGGLSQSAAIFSGTDDVAPLRGGVTCDYCRIAPEGVYRWGPVRLSMAEVRKRLAGAFAEVRSWEAITRVEVLESTETGRAKTLRLTGSGAETLDISAERFRLVIGGMEIRSTAFSLRLDGRTLVIENGRGFGHGLGLCQWGMEGLAREGRRAVEILSFYYPGAKLTRVY